MKYIVLSSHGNGGGQFVEPGDVVELDVAQGRWRTAIGLVKPYVAPPPPVAVTAAPEATTTGEPAAAAAEAEPAPTEKPAHEGTTPRRRSGGS